MIAGGRFASLSLRRGAAPPAASISSMAVTITPDTSAILCTTSWHSTPVILRILHTALCTDSTTMERLHCCPGSPRAPLCTVHAVTTFMPCTMHFAVCTCTMLYKLVCCNKHLIS